MSGSAAGEPNVLAWWDSGWRLFKAGAAGEHTISRAGGRRGSRLRGWAALVLASASRDALAQLTNTNANTLVLHSELPDFGLSLIRLMAALAIVLAVFFGGVWLFRNGQRLAWRRIGTPRLAVLESRSLGPRLAVYVIGYDQQRLLVGSSPAGLVVLSALPPARPGAAASSAAPAPAPAAAAPDALRRRDRRRGAGGVQ